MLENGFKYEALDDQTRLRMVDEHLAQLEAEHWTATLNKRRYEKVSMGDEERRELLEQVEAQLDRLEQAIRITRDERDALKSA